MFPQTFDKGRFRIFVVNLLNHIDESKTQVWKASGIKDAFTNHIGGYERLGTYTSPEKDTLDVLIVNVTTDTKLGRARTAIRNFVADHLKTHDSKDAALVAFVSPSEKQWRLSYVKMEYSAVETAGGRVGMETRLTPARRSSYIVGEGESCHTAQSRFLDLLQDTENSPSLAELEDVFSVEAVTKEFFEQYKVLFLDLIDDLDDLVREDRTIAAEFTAKQISTADFAKKLMGQIVFLYFLQKKGWLGVPKAGDWGDGSHSFLRQLFDRKFGGYRNWFNDILEPLLYDTLATDRGHEAWCKIFNCRIPFLNGGLFEPLGDYDWRKTDIRIPNGQFSNSRPTGAGDIGTGMLDVFDRYNFTVNEAEPLEKEVAIDPEMLGKVFENLLEVKERKSKGSFYTPREIVHYICQDSLINYLDTAINRGEDTIPREEIAAFIYSGDQAVSYEAARRDGTSYKRALPKNIETLARVLDDRLGDIAVCDPAIGSGAFPVGMMHEIVRARSALTPYFNDSHDRNVYQFKRHAIQNCLYGVDIDRGAVEIAKLRLWLSLVVDEDDVTQIKPLPNLDYKVRAGNSLLGVKRNVLNADLFLRLEELKPRYFDATDRKQKEKFKHEIDDIIHDLTSGKEEFDFEIYFSEVFHRKHGFDVVIANPPYIGESGRKGLFRLTKSGPLGKFYLGKMDYFYFFFHLALNLARAGGEVAFITTNYYLTAAGARMLRTDFRERALVRKFINFNELRIFESALGQHNIVTMLRKGTGDDVVQTCIANRTGRATTQILTGILHWRDDLSQYYEVAQSEIYDGGECYIRLNRERVVAGPRTPTINSILDKVAAEGQPLGKLARINQGVVSGCDYVSRRNEWKLPANTDAVHGDGIFVLDLDNPRDERIVAGFAKNERRLLRRFYKNSDIGQFWCSAKTSKRLLYIGRGLDDLGEFPRIREHLRRFEALLSERREVENGVIRFFQLQWPRTEEVFTGPKIVVPYRSKENAFAYNDTEWFCRSDCYVITQKDRSLALGYLVALLNSKLYFQWLFHRGKRKGRMLELFQIPLSEIPIKRISADAQEQFVRFSGRIAVAKREGTGVAALERELDELVYGLYGITTAERAIVDGASAE